MSENFNIFSETFQLQNGEEVYIHSDTIQNLI